MNLADRSLARRSPLGGLAWPLALAAAGILLWYGLGRLSFAPVPWPDGSAFSLPGLDLFAWPPRWKMSCISEFVESYERVNFQTMPGLSVVLGLAERLGLYRLLGGVEATRWVSLAFLGAFALGLARWAGRRAGTLAGAAVAAAALLDPVVRWGTLVVRTEIVIGLCWLGILAELARSELAGERSPRPWPVAAGLGVGALFHFNAVILVPAVTLALVSWPAGGRPEPARWPARLWGIAWRTLVFLSPWLLLVLTHPSDFAAQMKLQFSRLDESVVHDLSPYNLFHGPFNSLGSPVSWPKFYNVGKGLYWLLALGLTGVTLAGRMPPRRAALAAGAAFWGSFLLWIDKPEAWFVTLCHLFLWSWAGLAAWSRPRAIAAVAGASAAIGLAASVVQSQRIPEGYTQAGYHRWIDCIQATLPPGPRKVWQPFAPDALIELLNRRPELRVTRTLDFPFSGEKVFGIAQGFGSIVLSTYLPEKGVPAYAGPARPGDLEIAGRDNWVPMGWLAARLPGWSRQVCQQGPFWSMTLTRPE